MSEPLTPDVGDTPDVEWVASWGDQVKQGDLVRVAKLGGPVRVTSLRRFVTPAPDRMNRPLVGEDDNGSWFYGAVVEDRIGQQFHLFIQPHEAVFVAVEVPTSIGFPEGEPGSDV